MKQMKYLLALAAAILLSACGGDDADKLDPTISAERNALLASTQYGIYQEGRDSFVFNKTLHQLYVNPSKNIYRIQTDAGTRFAELTLAGTPTAKKGVSATLTQNVGLIAVTLDNVILLQTDEEHLWLWCDDAHTGFIVPRINIIDL